MNDFPMGLALILALSTSILLQGLAQSDIVTILNWQSNALSFGVAICGYKIGTWIDRRIDIELKMMERNYEKSKQIVYLIPPKVPICQKRTLAYRPPKTLAYRPPSVRSPDAPKAISETCLSSEIAEQNRHPHEIRNWCKVDKNV